MRAALQAAGTAHVSRRLGVAVADAFAHGHAGAAEQRARHLVELAIQRGVDVLVPCGSSASVAARRLTLTIPTVFISVGNPVGMGLVESLSHPARNVTGFSDLLGDLGGKLIDLSKELSKGNAVDYLWHTDWPDGRQRHFDTEQAALSAAVNFRSHGVGNTGDVVDILTAIKSAGGSTVIVQPSPFTYRLRERIIASAIKLGLSTLFAFPIAAREGALIAYGPDIKRRLSTSSVLFTAQNPPIFRSSSPPR